MLEAAYQEPDETCFLLLYSLRTLLHSEKSHPEFESSVGSKYLTISGYVHFPAFLTFFCRS